MCKNCKKEMAVPRLGDPSSAGPRRSGKELGISLTEFSRVLITPPQGHRGLKSRPNPLSSHPAPTRDGRLSGEAARKGEKCRVSACTCVYTEGITPNASIIPLVCERGAHREEKDKALSSDVLPASVCCLSWWPRTFRSSKMSPSSFSFSKLFPYNN